MDISNIFSEFVTFLKKPKLHCIKEIDFFEKFCLFVVFLFTMYFCVFCTAFIVKVIIYIIDFEEGKKIFNYQVNKWNKYSFWENIGYVLFIGPLIEELISRLYLDIKKITIQITMISIFLLLFKFNNLALDFKSFSYLVIIIILFAFLTLINQKTITKFGVNYYGYIFYFSSITFSFLHFSNFTSVLNDCYLWLLPILVLPQLVMGIFFGYIRIKLGFLWGLLLHICMNLPAVLIYLLNKLS